MHPDVMEGLFAMTGLLAISSVFLIGYRMHLTAKLKGKRGGSEEALERLGETVEDLRDQVRFLREEFTDLNERVDFAERLLTKGADVRERNPTPV